ncbi:helix-turn-helix domain-containing protein [Solimonas flava]|uniref:helix-turn-helix domain-containing protein n=1 Tax=Solimonas flava TaxID=415849 RepID=UPI00048787BA|nr:helix-turn-helix transcriptional regulator [Solimonas flava]
MKATIEQALGSAIRRRRIALGYSQETFADEIGMHRTYYSAIERGEKNLQLNTLRRVCEGLGVSASQLMREAENE